MTYALIKNGAVVEYPVSETAIKKRFPSTSFAIPFTPFGDYVAVQYTAPPEINHLQDVQEDLPKFCNGQWQMTWKIVDAPAEFIELRATNKAFEVRAQRNQLLAASDWTQLADAPVEASAWFSYRQELRDITQQDGFPWEVDWPVSP